MRSVGMDSKRQILAHYIVALMIGFLGTAIYLVGYHLYLDHQFIDIIRAQISQQNQQQSQQRQMPAEKK